MADLPAAAARCGERAPPIKPHTIICENQYSFFATKLRCCCNLTSISTLRSDIAQAKGTYAQMVAWAREAVATIAAPTQVLHATAAAVYGGANR
jgi:hypothetical protein